ncbi:MFS transporter [Acinetobacter baumannii]|uniref:MFS transporter n=1 Tax=Acinetobacter baumannii TaxID=470 RepID=UPI002957DC63|nr:MFS transporter [Acinetobacter baumannii]MDV7609582.1 MFS transporter [Acinetobacter baumannii]MDV7611373.1 MFS transporter [Acinetobacter baumannii]MDV7615562.1 MFS transporter [Acinetobacter baumannii]
MDSKALVLESYGENVSKKVWITAFFFAFLILLCDGADIVILSLSLTSLKAEWGLTSVQAGALGSWSLLGMGIGGIIGGWACDRFGRVRIITFATILFSIFSCYAGFAQSYYEFGIARTISCFGLGTLYIACNTLMSEYVPSKYRTTTLAVLMTGFTLGNLVITYIAGIIIPEFGWRMLYWITILPVFLGVLMYFMVPEPKSWVKSRELKKSNLLDKSIKSDNPYKIILKEKNQRKMFLLWTLSSSFLLFGFYGFSSWLPAYLEGELGIEFKKMTIYMAGTFFTMIFAQVISGYVADKLGRKKVFAFGTMGTALFVPIIIYGHTPDNIGYLMLAFGFLYGMPYAVNATYLTESFPINIRGTAVGGAFNIGRIFAISAPLIVGYLATNSSIGTGMLLMAVAYFICGFIPLLFIKERLYDPQKS